MKYITLSSLIILLLSCNINNERNVKLKTTLEIPFIKSSNKKVLNHLKKELEVRMKNNSIVFKFSPNEQPNEISIVSEISKDEINDFNSIFERNTVGFWNTYSTEDDIFDSLNLNNININGFSLIQNKAINQPLEIIGEIYNINEFDSIKIKLKEFFSSATSDIEFYYMETYLNNIKQNSLNVFMVKTDSSTIAPINNNHIKKAEKIESEYYGRNDYIICELNKEGSLVWEEMTEFASIENKKIAIIFNDKLVSCPMVNAKISGGKTSIVGFQENDNIDLIAKSLSYSPLTYNLKVLKQEIVSK